MHPMSRKVMVTVLAVITPKIRTNNSLLHQKIIREISQTNKSSKTTSQKKNKNQNHPKKKKLTASKIVTDYH